MHPLCVSGHSEAPATPLYLPRWIVMQFDGRNAGSTWGIPTQVSESPIRAKSVYIHLSIETLLPWFMFATWKNALAWPPQTTKLMSAALGKKGISVSSGTLYQVA